MNALADYAKRYEKEKPHMNYKVLLDTTVMGKGRFLDAKTEPIEFDQPLTAAMPGAKSEVAITREGAGRLYYSTRLFLLPSNSSYKGD